MTRELIIEQLKDESATAVDLAKDFNRSQSAIEEDLEHIRTTLRNDPDYQLQMRPALCLLCGFQFSNDKAKSPTKCPDCNRQKIRPPSFRVENRN